MFWGRCTLETLYLETLHKCLLSWGTESSRDRPCEAVFPILFNKVRADGYFLVFGDVN